MGVLAQFNKALNENYDEVVPIYKPFLFFFNLPRFLQKFISYMVKKFVSQRKGRVMELIKHYNSEDTDQMLRRKLRVEERFREKWEDLKLDAIISPCFPHAAFKNEDAEELAFLANFYSLYNVLAYPAGTVPVTEVQIGEDNPDTFTESVPSDVITKHIKNSMRDSVGMPIGI